MTLPHRLYVQPPVKIKCFKFNSCLTTSWFSYVCNWDFSFCALNLFSAYFPAGSSSRPQRYSLPTRQSGIPTRSTPSKLATSGTSGSARPQSGSRQPPQDDPPPSLERQTSGDSLEENFQELDRNLNDLLQRDTRRDRMARKADTHIQEWLRQTSKDAVPPDMLGGTDPPSRDISSPTLTENSLTYSQTVSLMP